MNRHLYVIPSLQTAEAVSDLQQRMHCDLLVLPDGLVNAGSANPCSLLRINDYRRALGKEYHSLYLHLDTPINLNLLAALIPTLKTGGTLLIGMAADIIKWHAKEGCSASLDGTAVDINRFVLISILKHAQMVSVNIDRLLITAPRMANPQPSFEAQESMLSEPQQRVLKQLRTLLPNHCCLLTGPRGSGKSTLAKILLSDWSNPLRVVTNWADHSPWANETIVTLERLLTDMAFHLHSFDVILIDEAATIPIHHLNRLAEHANVLLISTMDSYEGSGNGLSLKINSQVPVIELSQCFRFNPDDRLSLFYRLLFPTTEETAPPQQFTQKQSPSTQTSPHQVLTPEQPLNATKINNGLVRVEKTAPYQQLKHSYQQCYHLLAQFHYQTQPKDLFTFFNTTDCELLIYLKNQQPVALVVAFSERAISDHSLREDIALGTRRPKGRLMQQRLAHYYVEPQLLTINLLRISRIVVATGYRRQGIGSRLISDLRNYCDRINTCLVVSYASDTDIDKFWRNNEFVELLSGKRVDGASGRVSRFMSDTTGFTTHMAPILLPLNLAAKSENLLNDSLHHRFRCRRLKCFLDGQRTLKEVIADLREQLTLMDQFTDKHPSDAHLYRTSLDELRALLSFHDQPDNISRRFTHRKTYEDAIRHLLYQLMATGY